MRAEIWTASARVTGRGASGAAPGQIVQFGLTGGLIPWPAAVTVLLLCIQLKPLAWAWRWSSASASSWR